MARRRRASTVPRFERARRPRRRPAAGRRRDGPGPSACLRVGPGRATSRDTTSRRGAAAARPRGRPAAAMPPGAPTVPRPRAAQRAPRPAASSEARPYATSTSTTPRRPGETASRRGCGRRSGGSSSATPAGPGRGSAAPRSPASRGRRARRRPASPPPRRTRYPGSGVRGCRAGPAGRGPGPRKCRRGRRRVVPAVSRSSPFRTGRRPRPLHGAYCDASVSPVGWTRKIQMSHATWLTTRAPAGTPAA